MARCVLLLLLAALPAAAAEPTPPLGAKIADFTRTNAVTGKPWSLAADARGAKAVVVLFPSAACPVCTAYLPVLAELAGRYAADGVRFVAVYSHEFDDAAAVAKQAKEFNLPYPVLMDDGTKLADAFAVDRVPTAFVLDAGRTVRYRGRVDDRFAPGVQKPKATTRDLAAAVEAVLRGEEVPTPATAAAGCKLTRDKKPAAAGDPVTYAQHVAPIVRAKCQDCHRAGEAAPFALDSFHAAKSWSAMIREVVADDVMPPWHADAPRGHFKNDRRLSAAEKATLLAWVDQGCPEGDAKDLPPPRAFSDGWRLPRVPDEVLAMRWPVTVSAGGYYRKPSLSALVSAVPSLRPVAPFVRPADPTIVNGRPYEYVPVGEPFAEDKWVEAIEVRPEYRGVVHHVICFILPPGSTLTDVAFRNPEFGRHMLGAYVPGDAPLVLPPGHARKIEKGSQLVFEVHYTPNGRAGTDRSTIGLCYAKGPPKQEVQNASIMNGRFVIPEGAENHPVTSVKVFPKPTTLYTFTPHMHVRGKAFRFELVTPDGKREVLCNVPRYDFNWQANYELATPRAIPAGSRVECTAWYDNSAKNPTNPDPTATVRWGGQTWQEMMIGFVVYTEQD